MFCNGIDMAALQFFQSLETPMLDAIMVAFTKLGDGGLLWIGLCLLLTAYRPTRMWGIFAALALALTFLIDEYLLKSLFLRERPFVAFPWVELIVEPPHGYSFPSGHSATGFAVATCLAWCPRIKVPLRVLALILAGCVAFSRLYLSVHYLTDVLAGSLVGVCFGMIFGFAAYKVYVSRHGSSPHITGIAGAEL